MHTYLLTCSHGVNMFFQAEDDDEADSDDADDADDKSESKDDDEAAHVRIATRLSFKTVFFWFSIWQHVPLFLQDEL